MSFFRRLTTLTLDTIFPIECLGCRQERVWLCEQCRSRIPLTTQEVCYICKTFSSAGRTCFTCRKIYSLSAVVSFLDYDHELVQQPLRKAKYGHVQAALQPLIDAVVPHLISKIEALEIDPRALTFIPVPLHPRRIRDRGFNQAELIAQQFATATGGQYLAALTRLYWRPPQASLDELDRVRNIKGNIVCGNPEAVYGRTVVVVDDVATTGSTLDACGKALRLVKAADVWGMVLAKG